METVIALTAIINAAINTIQQANNLIVSHNNGTKPTEQDVETLAASIDSNTAAMEALRAVHTPAVSRVTKKKGNLSDNMTE